MIDIHYNRPNRENRTPLICVDGCWNFDMIVAIVMKNAAIVNGTGNKLPPDNI
jgi:hypothetical protein